MTRTVGELAKYLGAGIEGDSGAVISGVASPERAGEGDLIYLDSAKNCERAAKSAARCVVANAGARLTGKTIVLTPHPKLSFAKAAAWLAPRSSAQAEIHATAVVAPRCKLGANVTLGPYAVVEEEVQVGEGTVIEAFCFLGRGCSIGAHSHLHPRVTLYAGARLGDRVEVHSGAVVGADGFGYVFGEGRNWKFPQIGSVEIGDDVEIGCNTTIDRGSLDRTQISSGAKIDNLVQVAHNVRIGEHTVIAAQSGISGSSALGRRVVVGGQVGVGDHCTIEDQVTVGAQAGVASGKTVRSGQTVWGTPARPLEKFKKQYGWLSRLPELAERLRRFEEKGTRAVSEH